MPQLTLSRRTLLAPTPGATGKPADKAPAFGQPGDVLKVKGMTRRHGARWFKATLSRGGRRIGGGYVVEAALCGQAGAHKVLGD